MGSFTNRGAPNTSELFCVKYPFDHEREEGFSPFLQRDAMPWSTEQISFRVRHLFSPRYEPPLPNVTGATSE